MVPVVSVVKSCLVLGPDKWAPVRLQAASSVTVQGEGTVITTSPKKTANFRARRRQCHGVGKRSPSDFVCSCSGLNLGAKLLFAIRPPVFGFGQLKPFVVLVPMALRS